MIGRRVFACVPLCALLSISAAGAATLTNYTTEADFRAGVPAGFTLNEEYFDGFADGTVIEAQVPGIVFSSNKQGRPRFQPIQAFYTNRARTNPAIISGGIAGIDQRSQSLVAEFSPPVRAVSFWVVAQRPQTLGIEIRFDFVDGTTQMIPLPDNNNNNSNREFFGVTSDVAITKVSYSTAPQSSGRFNKFGGWDNLLYGAEDLQPPICLDEPGFRGSTFGVEVVCTDNGPGDSGITDVVLSADATNLSLTVDPFVAPAPIVTFFIAQTDAALDAEGTITTSDGAGNVDSTPINFSVLPGGVVVNEIVCFRDGLLLDVTNDNPDNPAETTVCSGSGIIGEPAFPFGYEALPETRVLTIDSGITGDTAAVLEVFGDFNPNLRGLFSNSSDGGMTFSDFVDITELVTQIFTIPDPTSVSMKKGKWSVVKYTFAVQAEICDGLDNDGDGLIDEGYEIPLAQCVSFPVDPDVCDIDGDGIFVCGDPLARGTAFTNVDCADQLDFVYPGAPELCNGIDDDCNGTTDDGTASGQECVVDGQNGVCAEGLSACSNAQTSCTQQIFPGDLDEVCDGEDNDCDGTIDEPDAVDASTWYADTDGDGFGDPSAPQNACTQPQGFVADDTDCDDTSATNNPAGTEVCDGVDNDCDGIVDEPDAADAAIWYADADGDGFGDAGVSQPACSQPAGFVADDTDCDDASATSNPAAAEVCDGADNDCDGTVDEPDAVDASTWYADADGDGFGDPAISQPSCSQPAGFVADATDCDDTSAVNNPAALEICDEQDNDCDGTIDEPDAVDAPAWYADADDDGFGDPATLQNACTQPEGLISDSSDCDDADRHVNPAADELCDGVDNDCDGTIDEPDAVNAPTWYGDADGDGFGVSSVAQISCDQPAGFVDNTDDCDDSDPALNPDAAELCDGIDNDCDTDVDEGNPGGGEECEPTGDIGPCMFGLTECVDGEIVCSIYDLPDDECPLE